MAVDEKAATSIGIIEQKNYTYAPIDGVKICIDNLNKIFIKEIFLL